jgi:hypothetical protein
MEVIHLQNVLLLEVKGNIGKFMGFMYMVYGYDDKVLIR